MNGKELAETWHGCAPRLLLVARAVASPSEHLAEDAVQEAFLALARQDSTPQDPFAWLVRVTRNQILQWKRSGGRRRAREQQVVEAAWLHVVSETSDQSLDAQEVTSALANLDDDQRQIIVMHVWGNMSFTQIASELSLSKSTAHRIFQSGIETIKRRFTDELSSVAENLAEGMTSHE